MKRTFSIFSIFMIGSLLLSACAGLAAQAAPQEEKPPLLFGWSYYPGWYPLIIAEKQGYFEKYGVDVELQLFDIYDEIPPKLAAGLVDGGGLVLGDALLEDIAGTTSVVLVTDNSDGADQMIASPELMDSKDLRGKRIGLVSNSFSELFVKEMLDHYGLGFEDVELVEMPADQIADAIPGLIDIGHTYEPFASQARAKGNGIFFTSADAPGTIVDTFAFQNSVLRDRPEDVRNFINAWFDAVAYWQANPEEGSRIIAEATGQNVADVNFEGIRFLNREENISTFQPGTDTRSAKFTAQDQLLFLSNTGLITKPVSIDSVLDPSYLQ